MVLSAARDRSSTESKFLPGLTRELLDDIEDDELRCGKKGEIIIVSFLTCSVLCCAEIMPGTSGSLPLSIGPGEKKIWSVLPVFRSSVFRSFLRLDVFQGLISRLPVQLSAEIASKPGILVSLTDQQVLCLDNGHTETIPHSFSSFLLQITFVSMHVEILELTSSDKILELVNTRPQVNWCGHSIIFFCFKELLSQVVPKLSWRAVDLFIRMPSFVKSLRTDTLAFLVNSGKFAKILEKASRQYFFRIFSPISIFQIQLPRSTLALFVTENPDALSALPR